MATKETKATKYTQTKICDLCEAETVLTSTHDRGIHSQEIETHLKVKDYHYFYINKKIIMSVSCRGDGCLCIDCIRKIFKKFSEEEIWVKISGQHIPCYKINKEIKNEIKSLPEEINSDNSSDRFKIMQLDKEQ